MPSAPFQENHTSHIVMLLGQQLDSVTTTGRNYSRAARDAAAGQSIESLPHLPNATIVTLQTEHPHDLHKFHWSIVWK